MFFSGKMKKCIKQVNKVLANEKELMTMIKRLPEPTLLFQVRHPQFQELVQFRIDVENIIYKYASKTKGSQYASTAITGSFAWSWRQWKERNDDEGNLNSNIWRNDWVFWKKNHTAKAVETPGTKRYDYIGTSKTIDTTAISIKYP